MNGKLDNAPNKTEEPFKEEIKSEEKNGNFKRESEGNSESFNTNNEFLLIKHLFFLFKKIFFNITCYYIYKWKLREQMHFWVFDHNNL